MDSAACWLIRNGDGLYSTEMGEEWKWIYQHVGGRPKVKNCAVGRREGNRERLYDSMKG